MFTITTFEFVGYLIIHYTFHGVFYYLGYGQGVKHGR